MSWETFSVEKILDFYGKVLGFRTRSGGIAGDTIVFEDRAKGLVLEFLRSRQDVFASKSAAGCLTLNLPSTEALKAVRTQLDFLGFPSDFEEGEVHRVTLLDPDGRRVVLMAE